MSKFGRTWLVVNTASGSNSDESVAAVCAGLTQGGATPARIIDIQSDGAPTRDVIEAAGVGLLAVFGGDGSINSVVAAMQGWDGDVLVLPGGTANLLAHALHGEREAPEIAASLASMRRIARNCVRSARKTALIELLAGPGATWSDVREELRGGAIADLADSALEAVRQSTGDAMVAIIEPPLGRELGYAGVRMVPEAQGMAVSGYVTQGIGDVLRQGIALLRRDFREGPHDTLGDHREIVCHSLDGSPIELMIDGERATGSSEETFSLAPLAVHLLAGGHD
jgi:Diacylglycerol kinase catalytic domain